MGGEKKKSPEMHSCHVYIWKMGYLPKFGKNILEK